MTEGTEIARRAEELARMFDEIRAAVDRIQEASNRSARHEEAFSEATGGIAERMAIIEDISVAFAGVLERLLTEVGRVTDATVSTGHVIEELRSAARQAVDAVEAFRRSNDAALSDLRFVAGELRGEVSGLTAAMEATRAQAESMGKTNVRMEQRMNEVESSLSRIRAEIPNISEHVASADRSAHQLAAEATKIAEAGSATSRVVVPMGERIEEFERIVKDLKNQVAQVMTTVNGLPDVIDDVSRQATVDIALQILKDQDIPSMLEKSRIDLAATLSMQMNLVSDYMRRLDVRIEMIEESLSRRRGIFGQKG